MRIVGLAINQAAEVRLALDGAPPDAPHLVAGRRGRATVEIGRAEGVDPTRRLDVAVELTWEGPGGARETAPPVPVTLPPGAAKASAHVWIEAPAMTPEAGLRVSVVPADGTDEAPPDADAPPARLPADEDAPPIPLPVAAHLPPLDLHVVPIEAVGGGCPLPDLGPDDLEAIERAAYARLPVASVTISVGDPYRWPGPLDNLPDQRAALATMAALRQVDPVPFRIYAGIYDPCVPCYSSCAGGLAKVGDGTRATQALLLGWTGDPSYDLYALVHEIGHVLGRRHVPCPGYDPPNPDPDYPIPSGHLDAPGLDVRTGMTYAPEETFDFMAYCAPRWVSNHGWTNVLAYLGTFAAEGAATGDHGPRAGDAPQTCRLPPSPKMGR